MNDRNKGILTITQQSQKAFNEQLLLLTTYIKRCPQSIREQLLPYCFELKKDYPADIKVKEICQIYIGETDTRPQTTSQSKILIDNLLRILQLKYIPALINKIADKIEFDRIKPQNKKKQEVFNKNQVFTKIDLLHPQYDNYYKMSKQERVHPLPHIHPLVSDSHSKAEQLYSDPRFLVRLDQLIHFRSNEKLKGDIFFLNYEGNLITGSKSYAVAKDRSIQVWQMQSNAYPNVTFHIPNENTSQNGQKKQTEEKKQKQTKNQIPPGTKFGLNNVYIGHTEKITSLSFSQDQYYLISGSVDRTIKLWCLRLKVCIATYRGHRKTIWDVHFSPYGYYFLSGSADGTMIFWKTDQPHPQRVVDHRCDIYKISFAKDPNFAISAGQDCTIKIWKIIQAKLHMQIDLRKPIINFNIGFSGSKLITIESDGRISVLDLIRGETINSFYFHEDKKSKQGKTQINKMRIHDACLSQDERQITCVTSKYVIIYSMQRLQMKIPNNIYTFFDTDSDSNKVTRIPPKEIIYMGIQTNLTYCTYQHKNILVIAGNGKN